MGMYLQYQLHGIEPVRIADDSRSQSGQTECLHYIPGSTMRGYIMSRLNQDDEYFSSHKVVLLSEQTRFLNAYLSVDGKQMIPSPKGFYEDKTITEGKKEIQNVVIKGEFDEGLKRASLGDFCVWNRQDCSLDFYSTSMGSDLKIKREEDNMFRNAFMEAGQDYTGYVYAEDEELLGKIEELLEGRTIRLGNARSAGLGNCLVTGTKRLQDNPYASFLPTTAQKERLYLYLLSDTVMRNEYGEYVGLDVKALEARMGVHDLKISFCSTSTKDVRGYNRTLGIRMPSVTMYEKGSVFQLCFSGEVSNEAIGKMADEGIGERRSEGYGRVLFFDDGYEKVTYKEKGHRQIQDEIALNGKTRDEDEAVLRHIATSYFRHEVQRAMKRYVVEHMRISGGISASKQRVIEPLIVANRLNYAEARRVLEEYYNHEDEKEKQRKVHQEKGMIKYTRKHVFDILDGDLPELLGIKGQQPHKIMGFDMNELLTEEEQGRLKLEIILQELRYDK